MCLSLCRCLRREYEQLREQQRQRGAECAMSVERAEGVVPDEADLLAEAKLLRQHKGRLEARMQILEDHNKQLESQLYRLRQLLHQVTQNIPWEQKGELGDTGIRIDLDLFITANFKVVNIGLGVTTYLCLLAGSPVGK